MQSTHAIADFILEYPEIASEWKESSNSIITLSVKDEAELQNFTNLLNIKGINFVSFLEPDVDNQLTAICVEPTSAARKVTSCLSLALKEYNSGINKHSIINN